MEDGNQLEATEAQEPKQLLAVITYTSETSKLGASQHSLVEIQLELS